MTDPVKSAPKKGSKAEMKTATQEQRSAGRRALTCNPNAKESFIEFCVS